MDDMKNAISGLIGAALPACFPGAEGLPAAEEIAAALAAAIDAPDVCQAKQLGGYLNFFFNRVQFAQKTVEKVLDYSAGLDGLPQADVLKFYLDGGTTLVVRPSGTEPKLKLYLSVTAKDEVEAARIEQAILNDAEVYFR